MYNFLGDRTDFEVAEELHGIDANKESYEEDLLMHSNLDCFYNEKCKVSWTNDYSFDLEWYTYYDTPTYNWELLSRMYKNLRIEGYVERNYFDDDAGNVFTEEVLFCQNGELHYEKYENDHELNFAKDCLQWTT